jgi:hypothetical protein
MLLSRVCNALREVISINPLARSITQHDVRPAFKTPYLARLLFQFETPASNLSVFASHSKQTQCELLICIHSFISHSLILKYHSPIQSQFSTQCDLVLPLPISQYPLVSWRSSNSCLRLLPSPPVTSILLSTFFSKIMFQKAVPIGVHSASWASWG